MSISSDYNRRISCIQKLREEGVNPYPSKINYQGNIEKILLTSNPKNLEEISESDENFFVSGRISLFRCMGKNTFITIQDSKHKKIQVLVSREKFSISGLNSDSTLSPYKLFNTVFDIGDFITASGPLFKTKKGEITIFAKSLSMDCKALLPLPDKHFGIKDENTVLRKRWLDMISNKESFNTLIKRSKVTKATREYMDKSGFTEVELPILQKVYGGANANPFITKSNDLKQNLFLRIALELPLKELVIGGIGKVYEIGKVFRNESSDRTHNPEFTSLEAYAPYWDYIKVKEYVGNLIAFVAEQTNGTTIATINHIKNGNLVKVNLKKWKTIKLVDIVSDEISLNCKDCSKNELLDAILIRVDDHRKKDLELDKKTKGELLLIAFEELCEHKIDEPTHIIDYPIESTPLCKVSEDQYIKDVVVIERFESFIAGMEVCNAYSELNDPILQKELMEKSAKISKHKEEYNPIDTLFLDAIDQGMPPTGGFGIGMDRLAMILTSSSSISEVLFFPMVK